MRVRCARHQQEYEESQIRAKQIQTLGQQQDWMSKSEMRFAQIEQQLARIERLLEGLQPNDQVNPEQLQQLIDNLQD